MPKLIKSKGLASYREFSKARRFISHSNEIKKFVGANKGVLSSTSKMIREMQKKKLALLKSPKSDFSVQKVEFPFHTNNYNLNIYRVKGKGFDFFVKESVEPFTKREKRIWEITQKYLDERGGSFMGFGIRLIKPHMLLDKWLVSDFYNPKRFVNVEEMPNTKVKTNVVDVIGQLGKNLHKLGVEDVRPRNVFYDKRTKNLVLFDIISQERYSVKQKLGIPIR